MTDQEAIFKTREFINTFNTMDAESGYQGTIVLDEDLLDCIERVCSIAEKYISPIDKTKLH